MMGMWTSSRPRAMQTRPTCLPTRPGLVDKPSLPKISGATPHSAQHPPTMAGGLHGLINPDSFSWGTSLSVPLLNLLARTGRRQPWLL